MHAPDAASETQLRLIEEIAVIFDALGIDWWLFGGWAMDFHAGEITRGHADVEIFLWAKDADRARSALVEWGYAAPSGLHPDEGQPLLKDGQEVGLWFLERDSDGRVRTPGRWADWPWVDGAFDGPRATLHVLEAPLMSVDGLLDMKERFATHPHGAPLREKDRADIELLRRLRDRSR
jgi:hypothetical protein